MEHFTLKRKHGEQLLFWGFLLFLFGLIAGLFIPIMANSRMGLSTHLEGVMNGIFLIVLGLIWSKLELSNAWLNWNYRLALFGTFANYSAVFLAAVTGAGQMMPIAGGNPDPPLIDNVISILLIAVALTMMTVCLIVLTGLYRHINADEIQHGRRKLSSE